MDTQKKVRALQMKFEGCTISQIAKELKVSKSTAQAAVQTHQFELSWLVETMEQLERHNNELYQTHMTIILMLTRKINTFLGGICYTKISKAELKSLIYEGLELKHHILLLKLDHKIPSDKLEICLEKYLTLLRIELERAENQGYNIYLEDLKKAPLLPIQEVQSWEK